MLVFNSTSTLPVLLQLCLAKLELVSQSPLALVVTDQPMPKFSESVLVLNPGPRRRASPWLPPSPLHDNSTLLALVSSERQLEFILTWKPQRFARHVFFVQLAPLPNKKAILIKTGFRGCVEFWEASLGCPELQCSEESEADGKEIRIAGFHLPPMFIAHDAAFATGRLVPAENATGVTVEIHKLIFEKLNMRVKYFMVQKLSCTDGNYEFVRSFLQGTFHLLHIPLTTFEKLGIYKDYFGYTNEIHRSEMTWAVPRARRKSAILNLVLPFDLTTWISVLVAVLLLWFLGRASGHHPSRAFLSAVSTLLGTSSSSPRVPRPAVLTLRMGCLILTAVYQTKMASILTIPVFENELVTSRDVLKSHLNYYKMCLSLNSLVDDNDPLRPEIDRRTHLVVDLPRSLEQVAQGTAAALSSHIVLHYLVGKSVALRERVRIQAEIVTFNPLGLFGVRNDPLLRRLDRIVARLKAAGLTEKWERDVTSTPAPGRRTNAAEQKTKVTLSHLTGAFVLLGCGLLAATATFAIEVCFPSEKRFSP